MEIKIFVFSDDNNINNTHYKIHEYNNIIMYIQSYIKKKPDSFRYYTILVHAYCCYLVNDVNDLYDCTYTTQFTIISNY